SFCLCVRLPARRPLFPYTTLFRSYRGLIDVSDAPKGCTEDYFRTRSLAAYAIKSLAEIPFDVSAATIVDGYGDNGIDALYYSPRSEEHTSELQSRENLVCRLLLEK